MNLANFNKLRTSDKYRFVWELSGPLYNTTEDLGLWWLRAERDAIVSVYTWCKQSGIIAMTE